jgi:hypothetical protein
LIWIASSDLESHHQKVFPREKKCILYYLIRKAWTRLESHQSIFYIIWLGKHRVALKVTNPSFSRKKIINIHQSNTYDTHHLNIGIQIWFQWHQVALKVIHHKIFFIKQNNQFPFIRYPFYKIEPFPSLSMRLNLS